MNGRYNAYLTVSVQPNLIMSGRDIYMQEKVLDGGAVNTSELRFVLIWSQVDDPVRSATFDNSSDLDLDAHLMGPNHPYFIRNVSGAPARFDMNWRYAHTTANADTNAQTDWGMTLAQFANYVEQDIDSTTPGRPEFITLRDMVDDVTYVANGYEATGQTTYYNFYVRDYYRSPDYTPYKLNTNGIRTANPDTVLSQSNAKVVVYQGERQLEVFRVPYGNQGCDWNVCRLYLYRANGDSQPGIPVIEPVDSFDTFDDLNYVAFAASARANTKSGAPQSAGHGKAIAQGFGPLLERPVNVIKQAGPVLASH